MRLAKSRGRTKSPKIRHLGTVAQLSGYIFATKARIDNQKKLLDSNISPTCPHNMVNFGPLAAELVRLFGAPKQIWMRFASWRRYCTAFEQWAPAKLCGVEQRAPPIFGRAAITLGLGPHSSLCFIQSMLCGWRCCKMHNASVVVVINTKRCGLISVETSVC